MKETYLVSKTYVEDFNAAVNALQKQGWELHGNLSCCCNAYVTNYSQLMVKELPPLSANPSKDALKRLLKAVKTM